MDVERFGEPKIIFFLFFWSMMVDTLSVVGVCGALVALFIAVELLVRFLIDVILKRLGRRTMSLLEVDMVHAPADLNICGVVQCAVRLDEAAVRKALEVIRHYGCLRSRMRGQEVTVISTDAAPAPTLRVVSSVDEPSLVKLMEKELNVPFSADECPLRVVLVQGPDKSAVACTVSHMFLDGISAMELLRRLLLLVNDPTTELKDDGNYARSSDDLLVFPGWFMRSFFVAMVCTAVEILRVTRFFTVRAHSGVPNGDRRALSSSNPMLKLARANTQIAMVRFDADTSNRIFEQCRSLKTTVGMLVTSSVMHTIATKRNTDVWVTLQAEWRRIWKIPSEPHFPFGNLSPTISFGKSRHELTRHGVYEHAVHLADEFRQSWNIFRISALYVAVYGFLATHALPFLNYLSRIWRIAAPFPVVQATMTNMGVIASKK